MLWGHPPPFKWHSSLKRPPAVNSVPFRLKVGEEVNYRVEIRSITKFQVVRDFFFFSSKDLAAKVTKSAKIGAFSTSSHFMVFYRLIVRIGEHLVTKAFNAPSQREAYLRKKWHLRDKKKTDQNSLIPTILQSDELLT